MANQTGKPLIQHVVEQVQRARRVRRVIVATDDQRIFDVVREFGAEVVMTRSDHPNGTSRIAEVARGLMAEGMGAGEILVNVQGDEPEMEPGVIDELIEVFAQEPWPGPEGAGMGTVVSEFAPGEDPGDPNIVKVVVGRFGGRQRALYFSRALIPYDRDGEGRVTPLKHLGIYAYRLGFLLQYVQLPATPLEQAEKLEQLRALEHGFGIAVAKVQARHHGIDTPQQYAEFVRRVGAGSK